MLAQPSPILNTMWEPPPSGWVKVNMDAAIGASFAAISFVACESNGTILSWKSKSISPCSPLIAEAVAVEFAIELAAGAPWNAVTFSGDSKIILDALNSLNNSVDLVH